MLIFLCSVSYLRRTLVGCECAYRSVSVFVWCTIGVNMLGSWCAWCYTVVGKYLLCLWWCVCVYTHCRNGLYVCSHWWGLRTAFEDASARCYCGGVSEWLGRWWRWSWVRCCKPLIILYYSSICWAFAAVSACLLYLSVYVCICVYLCLCTYMCCVFELYVFLRVLIALVFSNLCFYVSMTCFYIGWLMYLYNVFEYQHAWLALL